MKFKLFSYEEVDSTNNIAMNLIKTKNYNNGFIVDDMTDFAAKMLMLYEDVDLLCRY